MTTRAVILAAGRGGRLERHTDGRPKGLVPVAGRPLIDYVLRALARAGVEEAVVVLGHAGEQLRAALGSGERYGLRLRYVWNADYSRGNASSLFAALDEVDGRPFLLTMGDHLCSASLVRSMIERPDGRPSIAIDRSQLEPERTAEATKVALRNGMVVDIGKEIERWDAVDCGLSFWPAGALAATPPEERAGELAALMARLARDPDGLATCDVTGSFWLDIDTEDDRLLAEQRIESDDRLLD